ncbi:MAG: hypothetical protein JXR63_09520 [Spirochaetales bacterium]|nr:hypothetical protein [Spirochaetales bacterium]
MKKIIPFVLFMLSIPFCFCGEKIDLSGEWMLSADANEVDEAYRDCDFTPVKISLPGTTDEAGFGKATAGSDFGILTRKVKFRGEAEYRREIVVPEDWRGRAIYLTLERVLWSSEVFVDGVKLSRQDSLVTAHRHNLGSLEPGRHQLLVKIDNRMQHNIGDKGHGYTEYTQTIWNGILGDIFLEAVDAVDILSADVITGSDKAELRIMVKNSGDSVSGNLSVRLLSADSVVFEEIIPADFKLGAANVSVFIPLEKIKLWSEFTPVLYGLEVAVSGEGFSDSFASTTGFRQISAAGNKIILNGDRIFLRGNLDCVHFPLTGYPPCDKEGWLRVFQQYKNYGLNHVRFHSWCPPEAAFEAADELGIYIQAEAPIWLDSWMKSTPAGRPEMRTEGLPDGLGRNDSATAFIYQEARRLIEAYSIHPSFVMFCTGNELGTSDFSVLSGWMAEFRALSPNKLYAASTARTVTNNCQYSATHRFPSIGGMREKMANHTAWNYDSTYSKAPVPVIAHEIGQWPVYPLWSEIDKYTGVLDARNLKMFKAQAESMGLLEMNEIFQKVSGAVSIQLYKDEIEAFARTNDCSGYQLLGIQDYAGQGEALIGWLDSFYESKGTASVEFVRQFINDTVILAELPKYIYGKNEILFANIRVSNYSQKVLGEDSLSWALIDLEKNSIVREGGISHPSIARGRLSEEFGLSTDLAGLAQGRYLLKVFSAAAKVQNSWKIWILDGETASAGEVVVTSKWNNAAKSALRSGKKVLLVASGLGSADSSNYAAFKPLYWSGTFFPGQNRAILGTSFKKDHLAFGDFPADYYSDWLWWNLCDKASGFHLNSLSRDIEIIGQPVPDFHFNSRIATIFEASVAKGSLLVCGYDLNRDTLEARQLKASLLKYMNSSNFAPAGKADFSDMDPLFASKISGGHKVPAGFENSVLYVDCAGSKIIKNTSNYLACMDKVLAGSHRDYSVSSIKMVRNHYLRGWVGTNFKIRLTVKQGLLGTLRLHFQDFDDSNRDGKVILNGRSYPIGSHNGKGRWIDINVMREDSNKGVLDIEIFASEGKDLILTDFALIEG